MMEYKAPARMADAAALFGGWPETILWSVLQEKMGCMYVDCPENPRSAAAVLGDFVFLAGEPSENLVLFAAGLDFPLRMCIFMPQNEAWEREIEAALGTDVRRVIRYATKKDPEVLRRPENLARLQKMARNVPANFRMKSFDEKIFEIAREEYWSRSQAAQFRDYDEFRKNGIGVAAMLGEIMVSGASTYSWYEGGIEVQIDTYPDFQQRGLAQCCGARLILLCLDRGLYPSWDAHNLKSLALAEKFGYEPAGEYIAYEYWQAEPPEL